MLISAKIRYATPDNWSTQRYLDMSRVQNPINEVI